MAILKYLVPYTVGVLAIIYFQTDFAFAADTCYSCSDSNSTCTVDALNETIQTNFTTCNTKNGGFCGGLSYTLNGTVYVERVCDLDCDQLDNYAILKNATQYVCKTCNDSLCNTFDLSGASRSIGISVISLLGAMITLYSL